MPILHIFRIPLSFSSSQHFLCLLIFDSFSASASNSRTAMEEYDSNSSDTLLTRVVECRFCRRTRKDQSNFEEFNYAIIEPIAEGGYGRVYRCRDTRNDRIVAMKKIEFLNTSQGVPTSVIREISLLKELNHINIVCLLDVISRGKYVHLVFEHLDYDLRRYITDQRFAKDALTRKSFLQQILSAVAYCHAHKILHRDLKPKNLLIDDARKIIKLADFGLAREFGDPDMLYTEHIATRWYRAPEVLLDPRHYSTPVDLWSVGCIFGEMVIGKPIFRATNCYDELEAIFRVLGTPTEETWPGVSQFTRLQMYAKFSPLDLSTIFADLEPEGLNLLKRMLCLDPGKRISAEAALKHAYFNGIPGTR